MTSSENCTKLNSFSCVLGLTRIELWIHMGLFYLILCGICSSIGYALLAFGIGRNKKKLRTRFFIILWSLIVCRALLCCQYFIIGIYRALRTLKIAPLYLSRLSCVGIHFWLLIGLTLEMTLLLILVIDLALAVITPISYLSCTRKQAWCTCIGVYLFIFIFKLPFIFTGIDLQSKIPCINSYSATSDHFNSYSQNADVCILCVTVCVYLILLIYIKRKVRILKSKSHRRNDANCRRNSVGLKRHLELIPTLRWMIFVHCTFSLISRILRSGAGIVHDPSESARYVAYAGLFTTADLFTNLVALALGNKRVRRASFPCFYGKCNDEKEDRISNAKAVWSKSERREISCENKTAGEDRERRRSGMMMIDEKKNQMGHQEG